MRVSFIKMIFYVFAILLIFGGQFLSNNGLLTGKPPLMEQKTIDGSSGIEYLEKGPAIIYFWAEWCGLCEMMQQSVTEVLHDYPGITVAVKSGDTLNVEKYLKDNTLNWKVINDPFGKMSEHYKVKGVPSVFFLNEHGEIILTAVGYVSETGLRLRLWLVGMV